MSDIWKQFGSDYDSVNQNLGGAADWIKGAAASYQQPQPQQPQPISQPSGEPNIGQKLLAGMGAFNNAFMNVSPSARLAAAIVPGAAAQARQNANQAIQQAPGLPAKIGGIAGGIAGAVMPGPSAAGSIPGIVAGSAVNTLPYAVTKGANTLQQTGDIGQAAKDAAITEALGTGGGSLLGGLGYVFSKAAKAAHPILQEVDAASRGFTGSDIAKPGIEYARKMGLNPQGYEAEAGEGQLSKVLDLLKGFGGRGKAGIQKATQWVQDQYEAVNNIVKGSGAKLGDRVSNIMDSPIVKTMKNTFDPNDVDNTIHSLVGEVDKRIAAGPKGWTQAIDFLNKQQERGIKIGNAAEGGDLSQVTQKAGMGEMLQDSSSLVKAHLKDMTNGVLQQAKTGGQEVPDLDLLDQLYGGYKSLQRNLARRAGKPMQSMAGGSETTAGTTAAAALSGLIGGPPGAVATKVLGATALAPLLKRGVGMVTNEVMGRTAEGLDNFLQTMENAGGNVDLSGLTARTIGAAENAGVNQPQSSIPGIPQQGAMPQGPQTAIAPGINTPLSRLAAGGSVFPQMQQPQSPLDENTMATGRAINDKEQELTTQQVKDAQQTTLSAFDDSIRKKVFSDWSTWQNPFKGDFDSFYAEVYNETNGFDPKNANTARVIAGSDFANYQKTYQAALEMQSLGKDLTRALSYIPYNGPGGGIYKAIDPEGHSDHERLVNTLWTAMTGESKPPEGKDRDNIESRLTDLRRERLDEGGAKAKLMEIMQKEYGLNFYLLHQYGLLS